jgi:RNA polymerase sigma-70 factor (ECF subfamily)
MAVAAPECVKVVQRASCALRIDRRMTPEAELVRAAQQGDRQAFQRLVERYSRAVLMKAYGTTGQMATAEDVAQDTMMRAMQSIARIDDPSSFGGWLMSIAEHICRDWIRRKRTHDEHDARLAAERAPRREAAPDPRVAEAIAALAPELQQMLALRYERGMSCDEIARELGRPLGSVTKMLSRAYEELRERLVTR